MCMHCLKFKECVCIVSSLKDVYDYIVSFILLVRMCLSYQYILLLRNGKRLHEN